MLQLRILPRDDFFLVHLSGLVSPEAWDRLSEERRLQLRREGRAFRSDIRSITRPAYDIDQLRTPLVLACGSTTTTGHREAAHILAARAVRRRYRDS